MTFFKTAMLTAILTALTACVTPPSPYQVVVDQYAQRASEVSLGMSKGQVHEILSPTQVGLPAAGIKQPDRYMKESVAVDIIYYRSGWQSDGLATDDEYSPYIFNDDKLVGIGWTILGGPKTQGQVVPVTNVSVINQTVVY